jgi:hypothetical protein
VLSLLASIFEMSLYEALKGTALREEGRVRSRT